MKNYMTYRDLVADKERRIHQCFVCASADNIHAHHLPNRTEETALLCDIRVFCDRCYSTMLDLVSSGMLSCGYDTHNGMFGAAKAKIKHALGLTGRNLFAETKAK